jgi:hypothetical protein
VIGPGTQPNIYADFVGNSYIGGGASQTTFAAWLTAVGGTFSRASNATYIDGGVVKTATSGTARIFGQGIRLTGAATNGAPHSAFDSGWINTGITLVVGVTTAPDGSANGVSMTSSAGAGSKVVVQSVNQTGTNTISCFFKAGTTNYVWLGGSDNAGSVYFFAFFDLTGASGTVASQTAGVGGPTISATSLQALANGWYLASVTFAGSASLGYTGIGPATAATGNTFSAGWPVSPGNVVFYAWGFQITATAFLCDYIPTTTATVTQAADSLSFPYTQTTYSALGIEIGSTGPTAATYSSIFGDDAGNQALSFPGAVFFQAWNGSAVLNSPNLVGSPAALHKGMSAGSPSVRYITADGQTPNTSATVFISGSPTTQYIGTYIGQALNGNLQQVALWNGVVASNADLIRLTT